MFKNLHQAWTAELEPKAAGTEEFQATRSAYFQTKPEAKVIHAWIMEAHDWFDDKAVEMEKLRTQGHTSDPIKAPERRGSSIVVAKEEAQRRADA